MAFDVSKLQQVVRFTPDVLVQEILNLKALKSGLFTERYGIKYKELLNTMSVTPVLTPGGCGPLGDGNVALANREITVYPHTYSLKYCTDDLRKYFAQLTLGSGYDLYTTLADTINTELAKYVAKEVDYNIIRGNIVTGLKGVYNIIQDEITAGNIVPVPGSDDISISNILESIQKLVASAYSNSYMQGKELYLVIGVDAEANLKIRLQTEKYYIDPKDEFLAIPGFPEIKVLGLRGMSGVTTNKMFITTKNNLVLGLDEINEKSDIKFFFDNVTRYYYSVVSFVVGTQIAFTNELVVSGS